MKKTGEQAEISASKIGKFNTTEELLCAYNALESEFTKRCQLIKQLQAELDATVAQARQQASSELDPEPNEADAQSVARAVADSVPPDGVDAETVGAQAENKSAVECENVRTDSACASDGSVRAHETQGGASGNDRCEDIMRFVLDEIARNIVEYAEVLSTIPEVAEAAIAHYKQRLIAPSGRVVPPQGMAVIVPARRPRTLSDAKRLADKLING